MGATSQGLTGDIDLSGGVLALNLETATDFTAITGSLNMSEDTPGVYSLVSGQTVLFGGDAVTATVGNCAENGTLTCELTLGGTIGGRPFLARLDNLAAPASWEDGNPSSSPIPEPGSAAMFGLGGVLVGCAVRRRA